ncbi:hypothetical protein ACTFIU_011098 [Dictyostelium citrinum]
MWQKPSLTKSMMNEVSNSPKSPTLTSSPSSQSFANRIVPGRNLDNNRLIFGGNGSGGGGSLPSSPVSSPVNPFNPNGGGKSSRRRGVTVAAGTEQVETRRKILLGNSRPFRRRAHSMEVLNSWDFVPYQKKPKDDEQGQVDQYIQGENDEDITTSYESYITNTTDTIISGSSDGGSSGSFIGTTTSTTTTSTTTTSPSSTSPTITSNSSNNNNNNNNNSKNNTNNNGDDNSKNNNNNNNNNNNDNNNNNNNNNIIEPPQPSKIANSVPPLTLSQSQTQQLLQQQQQQQQQQQRVKPPPPSPRLSTNSSGSQSPPVPPRSSKSLGLSNDFSISLSSSMSSNSLLISGSINTLPAGGSGAASSASISSSSSLSSSSLSVSKLIYENNEENKFVVVSGPKDQLVEYLCNKNKLDFSFVNSFILSFRYFIEPEELFNHLMVKYETKVQTTSSIKVSKQFEEIQDRIRQNILIIISVWVDCNYSDFEDNLSLHKRLFKLVQDTPHAVFLRDSIDRQKVSKIPILDLYEKLKDELLLSLSPRGSSSNYSLSGSGGISNIGSSGGGSDIKNNNSNNSNNNSNSSSDIKNIKNSFFSLTTMMDWLMNHLSIGYATADSILKKLFKLKVIGSLGSGGGFTNISSSHTNSNSKSSKEELYFFTSTKSIINKEIYSRSFMDYSPQDIAKQLTLIEFKLFQNVKMKELYHKSWTIGKSKFENSPNIMSLITMSNKIANWVATEVVTTPHPKKRVEVLKRFISVAEHCKKINNFNTLMEVISGLSNSAVSRLKDTWKSLPTRYVNSFNSLQNFLKTDENWKSYRQTLKTKETPCLPYLGLFLQDINFIEDGNSNFSENDWVNFKKMNLLTSVFTEIQYFQRHPYFSFSTHQNIQTYFEKDIVILPEKELYAFSKFIESPSNPLFRLSKSKNQSIFNI